MGLILWITYYYGYGSCAISIDTIILVGDSLDIKSYL